MWLASKKTVLPVSGAVLKFGGWPFFGRRADVRYTIYIYTYTCTYVFMFDNHLVVVVSWYQNSLIYISISHYTLCQQKGWWSMYQDEVNHVSCLCANHSHKDLALILAIYHIYLSIHEYLPLLRIVKETSPKIPFIQKLFVYLHRPGTCRYVVCLPLKVGFVTKHFRYLKWRYSPILYVRLM